MSVGSGGAISGPEVDMAEMETGLLAVDLSLNLGPSFALELAVGRGLDSEGAISISRHNWPPRFEPRMTGMLHEEDGPAVADISDNSHTEQRRAFENPPAACPPTLSSTGGPRLHMRRNSRNMMFYGPFRPPSTYLDGPQALTDPIEPEVSAHQVELTGLELPSRGEILVTAGLEESAGDKESEKKVEGNEGAKHFECNICLEMATEPVVTCCGHLFCWPCLHQWLHVYAQQKECPVCKGPLFDGAITPIYGRGSDKHLQKTDIHMPPRPSACRISNGRDQRDVSFQEISASVDHVERGDSERSPVAAGTGDVLNRLRVAQRLQSEHSAELLRTRLHRRLVENQGHMLQASINSIANVRIAAFDPMNALQNQGEQLLNINSGTLLGTVDGLAAIEASMDGLRENLAHMQRSLEIASSISEEVGRLVSGEGSTSRLPDLMNSYVDEPGVAATRPVENVNGGESWQGSSGQYMHQGESSLSGFFDAEPSSLNAQKRCRLN